MKENKYLRTHKGSFYTFLHTHSRKVGLVGTILFHSIIIALLVFFGFPHVDEQEESGILVVVGEDLGTDEGELNHSDVDMPQEPMEPIEESQPEPQPEVKEAVITQDQEKSLALEELKKKEEKAKIEKKKLELEKKKLLAAEQERKKQEAEKQRKKDLASHSVGNAFSASKKNTALGTTNGGNGAKGSPNGNSDTGATSGHAGNGSYDLGGRGIKGRLPEPNDVLNEFGVIKISIVVGPNGKVLEANVDTKGTTSTSAALRQRCLQAAYKAVFNEAKEDRQYGSITYNFDMKVK